MIKLIDRYLSAELLEPFLFGLTSFTLILSASMVLFELVRAVIIAGMPMHIAIQLFIYKLPSVVVYIFPMATLLGVILCFARLSADNEIIAFKSGGVSLVRIVVPILVWGLVISIVTLLFYEFVVPYANRAAKDLTVQTKIEKSPRMRDNVFLPEIESGVLKRIFYARKITGSTMDGVIVQEFVDGKLSEIINAKTATWADDKWIFREGIIYLLSETGEYKHLIKFDEQVISIKYNPADFYVEESRPEEMNYEHLRSYIALKKKMGVNVVDLLIQLNLKISIPFASFVFALLGAALGFNPSRRSSSIGLGLSIIVVFLYYVLMFVSMAAGEMELISPFWAAWLPNLVTGSFGFYMLYRSSQ